MKSGIGHGARAGAAMAAVNSGNISFRRVSMPKENNNNNNSSSCSSSSHSNNKTKK